MKLYLIRHGKALDGNEDSSRPLSGEGIEETRKMSQFLGFSCGHVCRIFHSGKRRARETAEIIHKDLKLDNIGI